jgi:transcriptional regulator with XRE-family HTH domain
MAQPIRSDQPASAPIEESATSLGAAIRTHRKAAGLTLQEVAQKADLSISYLSQIERNLLTPSLSTLKRVADVLSIPAGELMFSSDGASGPGTAIGVVRRKSRKRLFFPGSDICYEMLTPDMRRRASLLWIVAPPGSESGSVFSHEGEDGVVVLSGVLDVEVGDVWHVLEAGDSIYFNAELSHRWRNSHSEPVEAIWLSTPPSF